MASKTIQKFRQNGLAQPIRTRPGLLSWLFLLLGAPFLIGGSIFALTVGGPIEMLAGLIGLPFFGFGFLIYLVALLRARRRGMLEFSDRGIYHGLYGLEIPWTDVGPAWIFAVRAGGSEHRDVVFILRNASKHKSQLGSIERFHFGINERQSRSKSGGALDTGMKAFGLIFRDPDAGSSAVSFLEDMRNRLADDDNSIMLGIPRIIRFGLSNEDTVEIINTVLIANQDLHQTVKR